MSSKVKLHVMRNRVPFVHFGSSARQFYQASLKVSIYFYSSCHFLLKAVLWTLQSLSSSHIILLYSELPQVSFFMSTNAKRLIQLFLSHTYLFFVHMRCLHSLILAILSTSPTDVLPCHHSQLDHIVLLLYFLSIGVEFQSTGMVHNWWTDFKDMPLLLLHIVRAQHWHDPLVFW